MAKLSVVPKTSQQPFALRYPEETFHLFESGRIYGASGTETKYSVVICRASTVRHIVRWVPGITERTGQTRSLPSQSAPSRVLSGTISVLCFILRVSLGMVFISISSKLVCGLNHMIFSQCDGKADVELSSEHWISPN